jgi:hypothetical protein
MAPQIPARLTRVLCTGAPGVGNSIYLAAYVMGKMDNAPERPIPANAWLSPAPSANSQRPSLVRFLPPERTGCITLTTPPEPITLGSDIVTPNSR